MPTDRAARGPAGQAGAGRRAAGAPRPRRRLAKVAPGELFVAIPGFKQDGRRFIADALGRGAGARGHRGPDALAGSAAARVLVPSAREALARLAGRLPRPSVAARSPWSGSPAPTARRRRRSWSRRSCARGRPTGLIGTIEYGSATRPRPASQTTPEALELQALLARMVRRGRGGVAMEVSSHALALHRVDGIEFDVAVFTNLTQDHLDFHGTLEAYRDAKARLFEPARRRRPRPAHRGGQRRRSGGRGDGARRLDLPVLTFGLGPAPSVRARRAHLGHRRASA